MKKMGGQGSGCTNRKLLPIVETMCINVIIVTVKGRSSSTRTRGSSSWRRWFRSLEARASLRMETIPMEKLWRMAIITEMESTMEMGKLQQTDTMKMTTNLVLCSFSQETEALFTILYSILVLLLFQVNIYPHMN